MKIASPRAAVEWNADAEVAGVVGEDRLDVVDVVAPEEAGGGRSVSVTGVRVPAVAGCPTVDRMRLSPHAARVLGCLVEKARTTPDQYPLSLNALVTACNQTTNRWPVVRYDEGTVEAALDELRGARADPA